MEEVDSIILHFLRQLNISIDEDVKNICDLSVETIVEAVSTCLVTINQSIKVPRKLPPGISHRIEVAAQIASICKELGYKNDVGYQTFLYYNETELRQVFMFLIEQLPNEGKQTNTNAVSTSDKSLLMQNIGNKIAEELSTIWIPPCCNPNTQAIGDFNESALLIVDNGITVTEKEILEKLTKVKEVTKDEEVPKISIEDTIEHSDDAPSEAKPEITISLKELKEMAIVLRQKLDMLESEQNLMEVEHSQAQKSVERVEADLTNIQNILGSIGISEIEFDGPEALIGKVHHSINMLHKKSEDLTLRNLSLKVEIDKFINSNSPAEPERSKCKKILNTLKETAKAMKDEYEKKEELRDQLKDSYDRLRGGNKRSIYTKRILEIISNVDKQNLEIKKILDDTRQLQKEINTLEGQLDRCFSIADETLFRDAKKDDQAKKAYKLLALLHSECNTIVSLVNDTGTLARDIVDLEENIKTESAKNTEDTLRKVQIDLATMQEEN